MSPTDQEWHSVTRLQTRCAHDQECLHAAGLCSGHICTFFLQSEIVANKTAGKFNPEEETMPSCFCTRHPTSQNRTLLGDATVMLLACAAGAGGSLSVSCACPLPDEETQNRSGFCTLRSTKGMALCNTISDPMHRTTSECSRTYMLPACAAGGSLSFS